MDKFISRSAAFLAFCVVLLGAGAYGKAEDASLLSFCILLLVLTASTALLVVSVLEE